MDNWGSEGRLLRQSNARDSHPCAATSSKQKHGLKRAMLERVNPTYYDLLLGGPFHAARLRAGTAPARNVRSTMQLSLAMGDRLSGVLSSFFAHRDPF